MPTVYVTTALVVEAGETLRFTNETAFVIDQQSGGPADVLVIRGTVDVIRNAAGASTNAFGLYARANPPNLAVTVETGGALNVTSTISNNPYFFTYGYYSYDSSPDFINKGAVQVTAAGFATGVYVDGASSWDFNNSGQITVTSTGGGARGISIAGSSARIVNSGTVLAIGQSDARAVSISNYSSSTSFTNFGSIKAIDASSAVDSIGVAWHAAGSSAAFVNNGWIEGDYALKVTGYGYEPSTDLFTNNGTLVGNLDMGVEGTWLVNNGVILGDATMGRRADTYDGANGSFVGRMSAGNGNDSLTGGAGGEFFEGEAGNDMLSGGGGADTLQGGDGQDYLRGGEGDDQIVGGADFDDIHGNQGDDTASGGDGDDWVVGGKDNDRLTGDAGSDIAYGNLGNDVLDGGAGADIVRGGQGDDVLAGGDGDDWLSGDRGADNITGGAGADVFHSFTDAGIDLITDFNFAEGDRVQLDPGTQYTLAQVGADTVVTMTGGGQLVLAGVQLSALPAGWIFGA